MSHVPIGVELDPARLRPSDNPVVAGDPSRIHSETQWRPDITIERTLRDLLVAWRKKVQPTRG
jgi:GDP-4-dehydro-6-deoxy-D-mannose reductase